jgi:hypothetical protein
MPLPDELRGLLLRYTQLGLLIPPLDDLDDPDTRAGARVVLAEMEEVQRQIDEFLVKDTNPGRARAPAPD